MPIPNVGLCAALLAASDGHALGTNCIASRMCNGDCFEFVLPDPACQRSQTYYYNNYGVATCNTCDSGYDRRAATIMIPGCSNSVEYYTCVEQCNGCSNCTSDAAWSAHTAGYEKKVIRTCNCNTCQAATTYRCAAGYYGTPDRYVYTGCQRCPGLKNAAGDTVYGHSTAGENENITDCWIDGADGPFGDNSGMYDITTPACIYVTD